MEILITILFGLGMLFLWFVCCLIPACNKDWLVVPLLALGLGTFAVLLLVGAFNTFEEYLDSKSWETTEAVITSSSWSKEESKSHTDGRSFTKISYSFDVEYDYKVAGKTYTGQRYTMGPTTSDESTVKALVEQYPEDSTVRIYYDPEDPDRSTMFLHGGLDKSLFTLLLGLGATWAAIALPLRLLKSRRSGRPKSNNRLSKTAKGGAPL
jgi:hypothetical protein